MAHRFIIADVFTDRPFGGNQLAVFPDGTGISDALMQAYARELNFSETTFVLPPRKPGHTHRVRIFMPHEELPFAGHPNIGTAVVLAAAAGSSVRLVFDEDVGTVKVAATSDGNIGFAELSLSGDVEIQPCGVSAGELARMLSVPAAKIGPRAPWMAGIGIRFCCVPLADPDAVATAKFDSAVWEANFPENAWARQIYMPSPAISRRAAR